MEQKLSARERALEFVEKETQFQLGFLPTEQSNPLTASLESDFKSNTLRGVETLRNADRPVLEKMRGVLASDKYRALTDAMLRTLRAGGRIFFSGCGATGRLAILLESLWRTACRDLSGKHPVLRPFSDRVFSLMTGGDFALIKSVESFEDHEIFGRRQIRDSGAGKGDLLVAVTEGGETSSVLGTVFEMLDRGGETFLAFNNPAQLLAEHLERSAKAIRNPRVNVFDLSCGPMSLAGSTRMQAVTAEQLLAGSALEDLFCRLAGLPEADHAADFEYLLDFLEGGSILQTLAEYIDFEEKIYAEHGKITYFTHDFLLDVFTDTTERSPTFSLPPFRAADDPLSPPPPAFVKDPVFSTPGAWRQAMARAPRCLDWTAQDYAEMGVADDIGKPPAITLDDFLKYHIGNEPDASRHEHPADTALVLTLGEEADSPEFLRACAQTVKSFPHVRKFTFFAPGGDFSLPAPERSHVQTPLRLMEHLALKLALNTISTGVMTKAGRVSGNWMSCVALSNKKLIDRGIRLLAGLGNLSYRDAALRIFEAIERKEQDPSPGREKTSIVQSALAELRRR